MNRGTFEQFKSAVGEYKSGNRYDAVDTSNRLGRFALGEYALVKIGLVNRDNTPTQNDYKNGWTGKYGITSTQQFLASPTAQDSAFADVLNWQIKTLSSVIHYDGQTLGGQEISISGMLGGASVTNAHRAWSYVKFGNDNFPEVTGQPPIAESVARFNGYNTPYSVDQDKDYIFLGREGPDTIRGYNGKDTFFAEGGNDTFDGGPGDDVIVLPHPLAEYNVMRGSVPTEWHIRRQLDDGSVEQKTIKNVEAISYARGEGHSRAHVELIDLRKLPPSDEAQTVRTRRDIDSVRLSTEEVEDRHVHPPEDHPAATSPSLSVGWTFPSEEDERTLALGSNESEGLAVRARQDADAELDRTACTHASGETSGPGQDYRDDPAPRVTAAERNIELQWDLIGEEAHLLHSSGIIWHITTLKSPSGDTYEMWRIGQNAEPARCTKVLHLEADQFIDIDCDAPAWVVGVSARPFHDDGLSA